MNVALLYRGPLASCNYACGYCPFARHRASAAELEADRAALAADRAALAADRAELAADRAALARFVAFLRDWRGVPLAVLFTPRGEALHHAHYQAAIGELSRLPGVARVAIQTNLSVAPEAWLEGADPARVGVWASYHPAQTSRQGFLARCESLRRRGVRFSVGMVGKRELIDELEAMRAALPEEVYLWVNAFKHEGGELSPEERARVEAIDPLFSCSTVHATRGRRCLAGERSLAVAGDGTLRRCHFVAEPLGSLYAPGDLERALAPRPCPAPSCRCHLGYLYLEELGLLERFGDGFLERAPERPWRVLSPRRP